MNSRNAIRLIEPRSGAVTRPMQKYHLIAHADKRRQHVRPSDKTDWWRPVDRHGDVSIDNDKSRPSPVRFAWTVERGTGACDLLISQNRDFQDALVVRGVSVGQCEVFHLHIGTRYYWKVTVRDADGRDVESAVRSFVTHDAPPRWIWVPEITNVRDMGGWSLPGGNRRVRQGMLYRSSEMNSHVTITEAGERLLVHELKIRTDLDLRRAPEEVKSVLNASKVEWVNIPIDPYGGIVDDTGRDAYRRVFALLAQKSRYPVLFHCWGGADRGGTLAFLIHGLLGVQLPDLVHDYELTSLSVWGPRSQASAEFKTLRAALRPFGQRANDIKGQVEGYLRAIGVTARDIAAIRALLTLEAGGRRCDTARPRQRCGAGGGGEQ
jgi:protein-tyrosine phosphatase